MMRIDHHRKSTNSSLICCALLSALLILPGLASANSQALSAHHLPAAEIVLPSEPCAAGGDLPLRIHPLVELDNALVKLTEQGDGLGTYPASSLLLAEKSLDTIGPEVLLVSNLQLPENLERLAVGRLPARDKTTIEPESKLVNIEVFGTGEHGEARYSGLVVAFEPVGKDLYQVMTLSDYLHQHGGTDGTLDELSPKLIKAVPGEPAAAEPVLHASRQMDKDGAITIVPELDRTKALPTGTITVTVSGYIYFQDSNGVSRPLPYVEVAVWEDDGSSAYASFDNILLTSSSGYFSTTVVHDDGDSSLELFLRVRSVNTWVRMGNYYDNGDSSCDSGNNYCGLASSSNQYQWTGPTNYGVTSGSIQMSYTVADSRKGAAQIFDWLMDAEGFTRTAYDPGQVRAVFGADSGAFAVTDYNWNLVFAAIYGNRNSHDVPYHEFGHTTMYRCNSYQAPNSAGSHDPTQLYAPGLAWSEGWATAYGQFVNADGDYHAANFSAPLPVEDAKEGTYYGDYEENASDNSLHNEMWAAAAINDFYDYGEPDNGDDLANRIVSFSEMIAIIDTHNIDSTIEFYEEILSSGYLSTLEKNYASRVMQLNTFNVPLEPAPQPLSVYITRAGTWNPPQVVTAHASGGTPPYVSYAWYRKPVCAGGGEVPVKSATTKDVSCDEWYGPFYTSPPYQWTPYQGPNQNIKVVVTDSAGASKTAYSWAPID